MRFKSSNRSQRKANKQTNTINILYLKGIFVNLRASNDFLESLFDTIFKQSAVYRLSSIDTYSQKDLIYHSAQTIF